MLEYLNTFFDKIYVINLKKDKERRNYINNLFEALDFSFHEGTDGRKLNINELNENGVIDIETYKKERYDGSNPKPGKIGVALSHISICQDIIEKGFKNALVFEDDINIVNENLKYLQPSLNSLPKDWEMVYLGYHQNETMPFNFKLKLHTYYPLYNKLIKNKYNLRELECHFPRKFNEYLNFSGRHYGAYAYGLTSSCALKYLKMSTPIIRENDMTWSTLCYKELINAYNFKHILIDHNYNFVSSRKSADS